MNPTPKRIPIYQQIRTYLLEHIRQGNWKPGHRLPSENELAQQFGGSRITVKQAFSSLIEEGIVYRIQGRGTFVGENTPSGTTESALPGRSTASGDQEATLQANRAAVPPTIAFIIQSTLDSMVSELLLGIEETASEAGYRVLFMNARNSRERELRMLKEISVNGTAGTILFPVHGETYNEEVLRLTMERYPIVVIDRYLRGVDTNCVCSDNRGGAYQATVHLIRNGHRGIGCISSPVLGTTSLEDRLRGYEEALAEHQIPVDHGARLFDPTPEAIARFLKERGSLTALMVFDSVHGYHVMKAAEQLGIRIPRDLSLITFDDYQYPDLFRTPPTVIVQPFQQMGQEAVRLVLELIHNPQPERRRITLPVTLVERSSVGVLVP
jgi:GntR family transcriptional regulator, arabinose operon transcriptional repressor